MWIYKPRTTVPANAHGESHAKSVALSSSLEVDSSLACHRAHTVSNGLDFRPLPCNNKKDSLNYYEVD